MLASMRLPPAPLLTAVRAAAQAPPTDLAGFAALREALSEDPLQMRGVESLLADEPGFAQRFASRIVPSILQRAASLQFSPAPRYLLQWRPGGLAIPRSQVAAIVAHAILGTLPEQHFPQQEFPRGGFAWLLGSTSLSDVAKLRCVLHWFDRLLDDEPKGSLVIERDVTRTPYTAMEWAMSPAPLTDVEVVDAGGIEDAHGCLQVDFANRFLGGGVLRRGCVQEEIRFVVYPELLVGMYLCPMMRSNEAIRMRGAERYSDFTGYARGFRFAGDFTDGSPRGGDGAPLTELVAIDARDYGKSMDPTVQFGSEQILREMNKAHVGFGATRRSKRPPMVATGHWGCGAFNGHHQLKAAVQWLAASEVGAPLRYYTFGDAKAGDLAGFVAWAKKDLVTAGGLYRRVRAAADAVPVGGDWRGPWFFDEVMG